MLRALLLALVLGVFAPALARAQAAHAPHVQISLIADSEAVAPGRSFRVALVQTIEHGWHTYWRNPGDSGDSTRIAWRLPADLSAGDIQWPTPERMPLSFLMNYGYAGEVAFPINMQASRSLPIGKPVTLSADVSWLVCSDICVPEQGTVTLTLPVEARARPDLADAARIAAVRLPVAMPLQVHITRGATATLTFALGSDERDARNFYFFPYDRRAIDHAAPQPARIGPNGASISLKEGAGHDLGNGELSGVLTFEYLGERRAPPRPVIERAYEVHAIPGDVLTGTTERPAQGSDLSAATAPAPVQGSLDAGAILIAALFAFLGGLILNIMPCVLPVLSIKALALAGGGHAANARRQGVFYLIGVLATFLALAALLIALRDMGASIGWGFQLQSPWMSAALALLFFAIGLNLLGVFEIGGSLQNTGESLTRSGGDLGALFTGVLAVVAATPCTAPFMAGAVGTALTQPPIVALTIFFALALGFAMPMTALSFLPALQRWLPKPGAWMERAKIVLAFPMFATAAWLVSVLSAQTGASGVIGVLIVASAIAFALVVGRWGRVWIALGVLAVIAAGAFAAPALSAQHTSATTTQAAEAWTPARVAALRTQGKPVFVNFTAAWCVTCQVNELGVLRSARVVGGFRAHGVTYLEADWTNPNPDISAALTAQGRAGVPLYLYYPPGNAAPIVLPQVLTGDIVLNAISAR